MAAQGSGRLSLSPWKLDSWLGEGHSAWPPVTFDRTDLINVPKHIVSFLARCFWRSPSLVWKLSTWSWGCPWQATPDITAEGGAFPHEETICSRNKITKSRKTFLFLCTYLWLFSGFSIFYFFFFVMPREKPDVCFSYPGYYCDVVPHGKRVCKLYGID